MTVKRLIEDLNRMLDSGKATEDTEVILADPINMGKYDTRPKDKIFMTTAENVEKVDFYGKDAIIILR